MEPEKKRVAPKINDRQQQHIDSLILNFIVDENQPFQLCDSKTFRA